MFTVEDYINSLYDLNDCANAFFNSSSDSEFKTYLCRFKELLNKDKLISMILNDIVKEKESVGWDEFFKQRHEGAYWLEIKEPSDEGTHIITLIDILHYFYNNNLSISMLAIRVKPGCGNRNISDNVRFLTNKVFMPLYSYIRKELEKGRFKMEESNKGVVVHQHVHGNGNTVTYSGRDTIINGQGLEENKEDLTSLIKKAMQELAETNITEDEKEEILDDLQTLSDEMNSDKPKEIKFKKVKKNIDAFIDEADGTLKKSAGLIATLTSIAVKIAALIPN